MQKQNGKTVGIRKIFGFYISLFNINIDNVSTFK